MDNFREDQIQDQTSSDIQHGSAYQATLNPVASKMYGSKPSISTLSNIIIRRANVLPPNNPFIIQNSISLIRPPVDGNQSKSVLNYQIQQSAGGASTQIPIFSIQPRNTPDNAVSLRCPTYFHPPSLPSTSFTSKCETRRDNGYFILSKKVTEGENIRQPPDNIVVPKKKRNRIKKVNIVEKNPSVIAAKKRHRKRSRAVMPLNKRSNKTSNLNMVNEDSKQIIHGSSVTSFLEKDKLEKELEVLNSLDSISVMILLTKLMDYINKIYGGYLEEALSTHLGEETYRKVVETEQHTTFSTFLVSSHSLNYRRNPTSFQAPDSLAKSLVSPNTPARSGNFVKLDPKVLALASYANGEVSRQKPSSNSNSLVTIRNGHVTVNDQPVDTNRLMKEADHIISENINSLRKGDNSENNTTLNPSPFCHGPLDKIFETPTRFQKKSLIRPRGLLQVDGTINSGHYFEETVRSPSLIKCKREESFCFDPLLSSPSQNVKESVIFSSPEMMSTSEIRIASGSKRELFDCLSPLLRTPEKSDYALSGFQTPSPLIKTYRRNRIQSSEKNNKLMARIQGNTISEVDHKISVRGQICENDNFRFAKKEESEQINELNKINAEKCTLPLEEITDNEIYKAKIADTSSAITISRNCKTIASETFKVKDVQNEDEKKIDNQTTHINETALMKSKENESPIDIKTKKSKMLKRIKMDISKRMCVSYKEQTIKETCIQNNETVVENGEGILKNNLKDTNEFKQEIIATPNEPELEKCNSLNLIQDYKEIDTEIECLNITSVNKETELAPEVQEIANNELNTVLSVCNAPTASIIIDKKEDSENKSTLQIKEDLPEIFSENQNSARENPTKKEIITIYGPDDQEPVILREEFSSGLLIVLDVEEADKEKKSEIDIQSTNNVINEIATTEVISMSYANSIQHEIIENCITDKIAPAVRNSPPLKSPAQLDSVEDNSSGLEKSLATEEVLIMSSTDSEITNESFELFAQRTKIIIDSNESSPKDSPTEIIEVHSSWGASDSQDIQGSYIKGSVSSDTKDKPGNIIDDKTVEDKMQMGIQNETPKSDAAKNIELTSSETLEDKNDNMFVGKATTLKTVSRKKVYVNLKKQLGRRIRVLSALIRKRINIVRKTCKRFNMPLDHVNMIVEDQSVSITILRQTIRNLWSILMFINKLLLPFGTKDFTNLKLFFRKFGTPFGSQKNKRYIKTTDGIAKTRANNEEIRMDKSDTENASQLWSEDNPDQAVIKEEREFVDDNYDELVILKPMKTYSKRSNLLKPISDSNIIVKKTVENRIGFTNKSENLEDIRKSVLFGDNSNEEAQILPGSNIIQYFIYKDKHAQNSWIYSPPDLVETAVHVQAESRQQSGLKSTYTSKERNLSSTKDKVVSRVSRGQKRKRGNGQTSDVPTFTKILRSHTRSSQKGPLGLVEAQTSKKKEQNENSRMVTRKKEKNLASAKGNPATFVRTYFLRNRISGNSKSVNAIKNVNISTIIFASAFTVIISFRRARTSICR